VVFVAETYKRTSQQQSEYVSRGIRLGPRFNKFNKTLVSAKIK